MTVSFTLPYTLPLTNRLLRSHWAKRRRQQEKLAWEIRAEVGPLPPAPMAKARVSVERHSTGTPDHDGLVGSLKNLMDCLCVPSGRHPFGLGFITDDSPAHCEMHIKSVRVGSRKDQKTVVTIEQIA